ncbi:hypothetical protein AB0436_05215 [Streptomyces sp. NPDC051322]|uniref:hypothetical protein n=1 Tax=Streptomyces sp. NPDC051322 TaxID=3154645 RepID=UPI00344B3EF3
MVFKWPTEQRRPTIHRAHAAGSPRGTHPVSDVASGAPRAGGVLLPRQLERLRLAAGRDQRRESDRRQSGIVSFQTQYGSNRNYILAAATVAALPMLALFPAADR